MRHLIVGRWKSTALALAMLVTAAGLALAANPHFVGRIVSNLVGSDLMVSWKEAGLGKNQNIDYVATADAAATYVCVNNGGECPNAANKATVAGPVSATGTFSSQQNGQITQSLVLNPPSAGSFACPAGQTLTLSEISYFNVTITDVTNGISAAAVPNAISASFFVCP